MRGVVPTRRYWNHAVPPRRGLIFVSGRFHCSAIVARNLSRPRFVSGLTLDLRVAVVHTQPPFTHGNTKGGPMLDISIPGHEVLHLVGEGGMAQVWAGARLGAGGSLKPVAMPVPPRL